jgi:transcriptional regulator with XRE-family HTH domain
MFEQSESKGKADNIDKLVSRRLKMRRVMLGMSQQDIGKAVDVSIQQMQKYEKATNRISSGKLFTIAKFLKVPITYFFEPIDADEDNKNKYL